MTRPVPACPTCSEAIGYRSVAFRLFPPGVQCPRCGTSLSRSKFVRLPARPFVLVSVMLGLAVGVSAGIVVTLLSRDWSYSNRFLLLGVALAVCALVIGLSRSVLFKGRRRD